MPLLAAQSPPMSPLIERPIALEDLPSRRLVFENEFYQQL
jgi:hypothetical protein